MESIRELIYKDMIQLDYFSESFLDFEKDFTRVYSGVEPVTYLVDDILLTMVSKGVEYFRVHRSKSRDGLHHYFYFKVKKSKSNPKMKIFEYIGQDLDISRK